MLTHPLRRLIRCLAGLLFLALAAAPSGSAWCLPQPIGPLSDYGSVLDRHGKEQIQTLIGQAKASWGIDVWILASWENPYDDAQRYASSVLQAWGLSKGKTLLAAFVKTGKDWSVGVVAGQATTSAHPGLADAVRRGAASLVSHGQIPEAMARLFVTLDRELTPAAATSRPGRATGKTLAIVLSCAAGLGLVLFALRRVCPRCGRILALSGRRSSTTYGRERRVYYCRRCGYTRAKGGDG